MNILMEIKIEYFVSLKILIVLFLYRMVNETFRKKLKLLAKALELFVKP